MTPEQLAAANEGLVATWLLRDHGLTEARIQWWTRGMRQLHDGVHVTGHGPVTQRQRWKAATLSAPGSALALSSAAAAHDLGRRDPRSFVQIVRPGSGGYLRYPGLFVCRSSTLAGHLTSIDGIPATTVERTIIDLRPHVGVRATHKLVREALRRGSTTPEELLHTIEQHRGRRGIRALRAYVRRFSALPFDRCRSDAEGYALVQLHRLGVEIPSVNEVFAGWEADLCWPGLWHIIEIDGPQFHVLTDEDRIRQAAWEAAGFTVNRLPSPDLYDDPGALPALLPRPWPTSPAATVIPRR